MVLQASTALWRSPPPTAERNSLVEHLHGIQVVSRASRIDSSTRCRTLALRLQLRQRRGRVLSEDFKAREKHMTLTAIHKSTRKSVFASDLAGEPNYDERDQLICPISSVPVILRRGHTRGDGFWVNPHFMKKAGLERTWPSDVVFDPELGEEINGVRRVGGESAEHKAGKALVAKFLRKRLGQAATIVCEYKVQIPPDRYRIADVAAIYPSGLVELHEVQLAGITQSELADRTSDYEAAGCSVAWWIGKEAAASRKIRDHLRDTQGKDGVPYLGFEKKAKLLNERSLCIDNQLESLPLSKKLALLLFIYGSLTPAIAAMGLYVRDVQVQGAASSLSKAGLIKPGQRGCEPFEPMGQFVEMYLDDVWQTAQDRLREWIRSEMRGDMPRWLETMLSRPDEVRLRARHLNAERSEISPEEVWAGLLVYERRRLREWMEEREGPAEVEEDIDLQIMRAIEKDNLRELRFSQRGGVITARAGGSGSTRSSASPPRPRWRYA